ncbi:hypothetical protein AAHE18_07G170500 [Arachis hypogaea]
MKTMNCKFWRKLLLVLLTIHMLKDKLALLHHIYLLFFEPCSSCLNLKEDTFREKES